ncbi:MAG: hypothetical protein J0H64_01150, partial [Actinobacteria bacterium]|nr:hypothetical protein [Actinomycetota bacterium]
FDGAPPNELRSSARTALALLTDNTSADAAASGAVSTAELAERLNALVRRPDWEREIRASADSGTIPGAVAGALQDAAAEAMRNADRHAGSNAAKRITARIAPTEISTSICDDGAGFAPERLPHDRLGVRESILHRMRAVQGGRARVRSAPGTGTEVLLLWRA